MVTKGEVYRHFKGGVYGVVEIQQKRRVSCRFG